MPVSAHAAEPIKVAHKPKIKKWVHNVFYDDRGFPDQSDEYNYLLHSVDGGPVLRKLRHPAPDLEGPVDPSFLSVFNPDVHESQLREALDLSPLSPGVRDQVYDLIREFLCVCVLTWLPGGKGRLSLASHKDADTYPPPLST